MICKTCNQERGQNFVSYRDDAHGITTDQKMCYWCVRDHVAKHYPGGSVYLDMCDRIAWLGGEPETHQLELELC